MTIGEVPTARRGSETVDWTLNSRFSEGLGQWDGVGRDESRDLGGVVVVTEVHRVHSEERSVLRAVLGKRVEVREKVQVE